MKDSQSGEGISRRLSLHLMQQHKKMAQAGRECERCRGSVSLCASAHLAAQEGGVTNGDIFTCWLDFLWSYVLYICMYTYIYIF